MTDIKRDDDIEHPSRYCKGGIECIDAIAAATSNLQGIEAFCTGNAIKYLFRWKDKEGTKSLKKAVWYINHLIDCIDKSDKPATEKIDCNRFAVFNKFVHSFKKTTEFTGIICFYDAYHSYCNKQHIKKAERLNYDEFEMLCYLILPELDRDLQ